MTFECLLECLVGALSELLLTMVLMLHLRCLPVLQSLIILYDKVALITAIAKRTEQYFFAKFTMKIIHDDDYKATSNGDNDFHAS